MLHVPYKGGGPATTAIIGGQAREAHQLLQREYERWGKIIRESGIKAD